MTQTKRIFLASSSELKEDRKEFEIFINRKNKDWVGQGVFIELIVWEDFLDALSKTRLQDEYNKAIRECDIFVMLFWTKVGQYLSHPLIFIRPRILLRRCDVRAAFRRSVA